MGKEKKHSKQDSLPLWSLLTILVLLLSISLSETGQKKEKPDVRFLNKEFSESQIPVLSQGATFPVVSAKAVVAVEIDSGAYLYEKNADEPLYPASTTKIATSLVALDNYSLSEAIKVDGIKVDGQKMGLREGETITVEDLLYGLLIFSANDAAEVLAGNFPEGRSEFISLMNKKAESAGVLNTNFTNPTGLEDTGHVSTARDLVRISQVAMKNETFAKIVRSREHRAKSVDGKISHRLVNINKLVGTVPGVLGIKTGWTENAAEALVSYIERDDKKVIIVLLGSQDRFGETREIIDWIFENYSWKNPLGYFPPWVSFPTALV